MSRHLTAQRIKLVLGLAIMTSGVAAGCSSQDLSVNGGEGSQVLAQDFDGDTIVVRFDDVWLKTRSARMADLEKSEKCSVPKGTILHLDKEAVKPDDEEEIRASDLHIWITEEESRQLCPDFDGRRDWYIYADSFKDGNAQNPTVDDSSPPSVGSDFKVGVSFKSKGTGYYPANNALEGGFVDRKGRPLKTLQKFLSGNASYVSVAMDVNAFPYGTVLHIKQLDEKYKTKLAAIGKKHIEFCVVDTGNAFKNKGKSRIDVCTANQSASLDPTINSTSKLSIYQVLKTNGSPKKCN